MTTWPFLVTGLPRSRTAWWSVVASGPLSTCLHEPVKDCQSYADFRELWLGMQMPFAGVSDSALGVQLGRILDDVKPRTLIVERDTDEAIRSFGDYMDGVPIDREAAAKLFRKLAAELRRHHQHELVKVVPFAALNIFDVAKECYEWLMPGNPWAMREDLFQMRVNVKRSHVLESVKKEHSGWHLQ